MKIEELYLKNFRNVVEATYRFPSMFTVVIGMNGSGKSTLLRALRVAMGSYISGIPESRRLNISKEDIRTDNPSGLRYHLPVEVHAKGQLESKRVEWKRELKQKGSKNYAVNHDIDLLNIGLEKYDSFQLTGKDNLNLSMLAFFGTQRVFGTSRATRKHRLGRRIFEEGYHEWYDLRASIYKYPDWLATYEPLVKDGKEYPESRKIFFDTILTACPYVEDVEFYNGELWLRTKKADEISDRLPLSLKSDGIITFVNMVAELAFRSIVLNGYLRENAIKETRGVVLIDELDLHLHPKWQEHVVDDLKKAFPNIQFIVTTHSPVIVQSLSADELINLDKLTDVNPNELSLGEVTTQIMGLDSEFSESSHKQELISKKYLELLEYVDLTKIAESLDEMEYKVIDPAVRAFLKMQRLKKESKK